jgi:adenosylhomocysteine nucleosidase
VNKGPILVCFAVREEARAFRSQVVDKQVTVLITGMGKENAEKAIRQALASQNPALVLTCGFAGGLNPELRSGTVLFDADASANLDAALRNAGARPAKFLCSDRVATTIAEKKALYVATGADAVEMESAIIRAFCAQKAIASVTVRVVLDSADEDLPLDFNLLMTPEKKLSPMKLAAAILKSPGRIRGLLRLQQQSKTAARQLAEALAKALANRY